MRSAGVKMDDTHWAIVERVASEAGHGNNSAALRSIVEQHERAQQLETVARAYVSDLITAQEAVDEMVKALLTREHA